MPPEFGRKWRTECLNTRFLLPILLYAGYSVKLIYLFINVVLTSSPSLREILKIIIIFFFFTEDAWLALRGRVYNITHYLPYHPGGNHIIEDVIELCDRGRRDAWAQGRDCNTVTEGLIPIRRNELLFINIFISSLWQGKKYNVEFYHL